jgi:hypothetical protein
MFLLAPAALSRFAGRLPALALLTVAFPPALGAGETVGVVTLSTNTSISGSQITIGQSIFSGDRLSVEDGAAEIALGHGSKIVLSPHTSASLERDKSGITAVLDRGGISLQQSSQGGVETRIRSGNVSVVPSSGVPTHAQVFLIAGELTIGAREGAVLVDRGGEEFTVAQDTAVRFVAQDDGTQAGGTQAGGTSSPAPNAQGGGPKWGRILLCASGGAAVGSIPVIVEERAASPDPSWRWGIIPAGALTGGLICGITGGGGVPPPPPPPPPKPPTCMLTVNPAKVFRPAQGTLNWTSQNATGLTLGRTPKVPPAGSQPVNTQGLPPGNYSYTMTAFGPGGKALCRASFEVLPEPCSQEFQYMNTAFRIKMGLQGANNILTVAGLGFGSLPGSVAGKVIFGSGKVGVLPATQAGKAFIISATGHKIAIDLFAGGAFKETCEAYALCLTRHGISQNGQISFTNALGREIGKCQWSTSGGNLTVTSKVWGWGHAVGILDW